MHFETALNLIWLLLGLFGLASTLRATLRKTADPRSGSAWLHIIGVGLIVAALFPYISATDDVVRIEHFKAQHHQGPPGKHSRTDDLVRLYETMDTPLVCRVAEVAVTFLFISLISAPVLRAIDRIAPSPSGRSPPAMAAA